MKLCHLIKKLFIKGDACSEYDFYDVTKRRDFAVTDPIFSKGIDFGDAKLGARLASVVPSPRQYEYSKMGFYSFIHFGMNTFTGNEWGTGREKPAIFNPTELDTDQWVSAIAASGAKGVILTAKHHDGFCLWHTAYTDHSVKNSPFGRDIVKELSESCKKIGLKLGLYLSPWDMHEASYGHKSYNDFFVNQLTELCTNYGELFTLWFDGARGEGAEMDADFDYDWTRIYAVIRDLQPNAVISIMGPDVRWIGNEAGKVRDAEWSVVPAAVANLAEVAAASQHAEENADQLLDVSGTMPDLGSRAFLRNVSQLCWYPAEADTSIRQGWFYHKRQRPKSLAKLLSVYYKSVGGNASLLLNIPPDTLGLVADCDVARLAELGNAVALRHAKPIAFNLSVAGAECVKSDDDRSFVLDGSLLDLTFEAAVAVSEIEIVEDIRHSQRIESYSLYLIRKDGSLTLAAEGTVVGSKKLIALDPAADNLAIGVRIAINEARNTPVLRYINVYGGQQ